MKGLIIATLTIVIASSAMQTINGMMTNKKLGETINRVERLESELSRYNGIANN